MSKRSIRKNRHRRGEPKPGAYRRTWPTLIRRLSVGRGIRDCVFNDCNITVGGAS